MPDRDAPPATARDLCNVLGPETATVRCSDGIELVADIYRPDLPGTHPVLLMRQPYGRRIASAVVLAHPSWYAAHGYIVVVQDVRGRGDSGGTFRVFADDIEDGAATLDWVAQLKGSSGRVGTYGFSYQGTNQLHALAGAKRAGSKRPDAIAPTMAAWTIRDDWAYEGGAFRLAGNIAWACQMGAEQARLAGDRDAFAALAAGARGEPALAGRPAFPDALVRYGHYTHYADWLRDDRQYWLSIAPSALLEGDPLDLPGLHVGGWLDIMLDGTLAAHAAFCGAGRAPQRLVIGPWLHMPWSRRVGAFDFGAEAVSCVDGEHLAFFDRHLKGRDGDRAGLRLFDLGRKAWRELPQWPATVPTPLYLSSTGLAAATSTDGKLVRDAGAGQSDALVHDPWRPAPMIGGALGQPDGFQDRTAIDERGDVAVYTTAPLDAPIELIGPIAAELLVEADQPSFDLACTLSIVLPDARVMTLASGFLRVADTGETSLHRVGLHTSCCTVGAGSSLRLSIQAAAWPAFAVNPGNGRRPEETDVAEARITTLRILHGHARASRLLLPIVA